MHNGSMSSQVGLPDERVAAKVAPVAKGLLVNDATVMRQLNSQRKRCVTLVAAERFMRVRVEFFEVTLEVAVSFE
jgi:hypothetical protein